MPNFKLTYGFKNEKPTEVIEIFTHLGEAMEEAQMRAHKLFESTEEGQIARKEIKARYSDPFLATAYIMQTADDHVDYFAEEMFSKSSATYLVTNQLEVFSDTKFMHISLETAIDMLTPLTEIGLDSETDGLDVHTNKMLLLQLGVEDFQIVFDISSFDNKIPKPLREFLREDRLYLLQNAKFDLKFLFKQDVILKKVYDTMLVEIIITNGLQHGGRGLDAIVNKYCGITLNKETRKEFTTVGITDRGIAYAADDVKYLPEVKEKQLEIVAKFNLQKAVDLDNVFVIALAYTEYCGIKLDYNKWMAKVNNRKELLYKYKKEIEKHLLDDGMLNYFSGMTDLFSGAMECTINWNSSLQVRKLFKEYGINVEVYKGGKVTETVNAAVLEPQLDDFPILKPYLKYKGMQKEVSTYGENWYKHINKATGRIHTNFWQLNDTGRLSSGGGKGDFESVNLQNIPADAETRACFVAEAGNLMIDADYSSQEQIILANFSKEPKLLKFYADGFTDMHSYLAFLIYEDIRRCSIEELTPDKLGYIKKEFPKKRDIAKKGGFAIKPFYLTILSLYMETYKK